MTTAEETPAAAPPAFAYFKKVMANMKLHVAGKPVEFELLDRNLGVLKLPVSDPLVAPLTAAANARRGGIVLIDAAMYEDLKKNLPFKLLPPKSPPRALRVAPTEAPRASQSQPSRSGAAAVVDSVFRRTGVGSVGGGGAGDGAGTPKPVPAPAPAAPGEFRPATGNKSVRIPVLKKPSGQSLVSLIANAAEPVAAT
jgi:hypothetical protein